MANYTEIPSEEVRPDCRRFELELSAYLEGEPRPEVVRHAESCLFCSALLADLNLVRTTARSLPQMDPPARVWANVRATLEAEGIFREQAARSGWFSLPRLAHWAAPAGALAAMALISTVLLVPSTKIDHARTSAWLSVADRDAMAERVIASEDSEFGTTVAELQKNFDARSGSLEPSVKTVYLTGLKSLDNSIQECRTAIHREPGNALARQYLESAYTRKAEILAAALKFDVP